MPLHHALDVEPVSEKALYVHESDLADPSQADVPVAVSYTHLTLPTN